MISPEGIVRFHLEHKPGLFTLVEYDHQTIVYQTRQMESEGRLEMASATSYKCLENPKSENHSEEAIAFHNEMRNKNQALKKYLKAKDLYSFLNKKSDLQIEAYFGNNKFQAHG